MPVLSMAECQLPQRAIAPLIDQLGEAKADYTTSSYGEKTPARVGAFSTGADSTQSHTGYTDEQFRQARRAWHGRPMA